MFSSCFWGFSHAVAWNLSLFSRVTLLRLQFARINYWIALTSDKSPNSFVQMQKLVRRREGNSKTRVFLYENKTRIVCRVSCGACQKSANAIWWSMAHSSRVIRTALRFFSVPAVRFAARLPMWPPRKQQLNVRTQKWWHVEVSNFQIDYRKRNRKETRNTSYWNLHV